MPFRTPQWKKNTLTWWSIDTDKDGSGSSLVLVYLNPYEPDWIRQMFTVRIRVKEEDTNAIIDWLSEHMPPLWKLKN